MLDLKEGQIIEVVIRRGSHKTPEEWKIHKLCPNFVVLDNGMYKTCVSYTDLKSHWSIRPHHYS